MQNYIQAHQIIYIPDPDSRTLVAYDKYWYDIAQLFKTSNNNIISPDISLLIQVSQRFIYNTGFKSNNNILSLYEYFLFVSRFVAQTIRNNM